MPDFLNPGSKEVEKIDSKMNSQKGQVSQKTRMIRQLLKPLKCTRKDNTVEPGRLQSMGSLESDTTERLPFHFSLSSIGEGNGNPLQCSCLENPRDRGAWWAAIYGVAQSWRRLSDFTFTFHFHALEKEMATHSRVLAW